MSNRRKPNQNFRAFTSLTAVAALSLIAALLPGCGRPASPASLDLAELARECIPLMAKGEAVYHIMPPGKPELAKLVGSGWFGVNSPEYAPNEIRVVWAHDLYYVFRHEDATHRWVLFDTNLKELKAIPDNGLLPLTLATAPARTPSSNPM